MAPTTRTKPGATELAAKTAKAARPLPAVQAGMISKANAFKLLGCAPVALKRARRLGYVPDPDHNGHFPAGPLIAGWSRYLQSGELMQEEAADLLGVSPPWIARLVREGYIEKSPRGTFTREGVLAGYSRWMKDDARRVTRSAEEAQWRGAKARKVEMETAVLDERVVETAEAFGVVEEIIATFRDELATLPAAIADPALRQKVADAAAEVTKRAEDKFAERAAAVRRRAIPAPAAGA